MVDLDLVSDPRDIAELRKLLDNHVRHTGSRKAAGILASWEVSAPAFVKVFPMEYRRILGQMSKDDEATEREAIIDG
jgi:glutamate synthase domain-containing protein 3